MSKIAMLTAALLVAASVPAQLSAAPSNDSMGAQVAVPAPDRNRGPIFTLPVPERGGIVGCYRVEDQIYGPYRMSFCLDPNGGGNYQVRGGGLNCDGGLDWYGQRGVDIDLYRGRCNRRQAWTGDSLSCRASDSAMRVTLPGIRIAVPDRKRRFRGLSCIYTPMAPGYGAIQVWAVRS